ncbi:MAG: class I SAM-dependent methyltransferase [Pseudomonadota bacterium]|nr:class I SAM-dependent methyltransferase [Pseudomonadota bacterium]
MNVAIADAGSFKDPSGRVYEIDGEILRSVAPCAAVKPALLWDLGCNTGEYAEVALAAGAGRVIGFDFDHKALERAYGRAIRGSLPFLPLFQDGANPSPAQGWSTVERKGLSDRASADGLLALAFQHHLCIGRNVPLDEVVAWLVSLAPRGVDRVRALRRSHRTAHARPA